MTEQKKIKEGMARRLFDSEMNRDQVFGVAHREKAWADEKETWLARAGDELAELHSEGVVIKVDREFPDIEQVFANVANLSKEVHKNVLGDKWKFINAVRKSLDGYTAFEPIIEEAK